MHLAQSEPFSVALYPGYGHVCERASGCESDPTRLEVVAAIRNNICRCTGYKKIIEGILLSGKIFRENLPVSENSGITKVGDKIQRVDAAEKVLGTGEYPDDIYLDA